MDDCSAFSESLQSYILYSLQCPPLLTVFLIFYSSFGCGCLFPVISYYQFKQTLWFSPTLQGGIFLKDHLNYT